ncbi:MAG: hypothetical protein V4459_05435 [Pseudomonadota bacterium]
MTAFGVVVLLLGGCQSGSTPQSKPTPTSLEAAAIDAGIVADPANTDPTGLYARDRDKVCIVPTATAYRVGVTTDYGDGNMCSGTGQATRAGETLHIDLTSAPGCSFDARFEGDRIVFPGQLPDACLKVCARRASILGLTVGRLSDSSSEAEDLRDSRGRTVCGDAS